MREKAEEIEKLEERNNIDRDNFDFMLAKNQRFVKKKEKEIEGLNDKIEDIKINNKKEQEYYIELLQKLSN